MYVIKKNGEIVNKLSMDIVKTIKEKGLEVAFVERLLSFDGSEFVDDITDLEIEKGKEEIRKFLYREIADPLFFKVQRGEIEESVWLDEIQKIKDEWR